MKVKITVVCNNLADPLIEDKDSKHVSYPRPMMRMLVGEHGLAYHLNLGKEDKTCLLFDTGGTRKTFPANIINVQPDPSLVSDIIISHGHHDHVGGLLPFLDSRNTMTSDSVTIWCHPDALSMRMNIKHEESVPVPFSTKKADQLRSAGHLTLHQGVSKEELVSRGCRICDTAESVIVSGKAGKGITVKTTGEIPRLIEKNTIKHYVIKREENFVIDYIMDDQALIVENHDKGMAALLLGCCHAGIENTMERANQLTTLPFKIIAGGFHLVGVDDGTIKQKHEALERLASAQKRDVGSLIVRPTHCSGERFYLWLKAKASSLLEIERLPLGTRMMI